MEKLTHHSAVILLIQISIMLLFGRFLAEIVKKWQVPGVIGEIIAGVILGPTVIGYLFPEWTTFLFPLHGQSAVVLSSFTFVAVILLLFTAGFEVEFHLIFAQGYQTIVTSIAGIVLCFVFGFTIPIYFDDWIPPQKTPWFVFSLFLGTALSISALPVIARTLMDLNLLKSKIGMLIISTAMVEDFIGWMFFAIVLGLINTTEFDPLGLLKTVFLTIIFAALVLGIGRRFFDRILPLINNRLSFPGGILAFSITMGLLGAAFTEFAGIHAIFGAFIVGVALSDSIHMSKKTKQIIHDFVDNVFAPLFFVSIGLTVNFIDNFDFYLSALILVIALLGKIIGCGLGALMGGFTFRESLAVGFGMSARGAMEIILASLALQAGVIDHTIFVALVVMALLTSIIAGQSLKWILPQKVRNASTSNGYIIFGNNEIGQWLAQYLSKRKIPVLLADHQKPKLTKSKIDLVATYFGNLLDKRNLEKLDLTRYGKLLAVSEDEDLNEAVCNFMAYEFGEKNIYRLISRKESKSSSLSLPQNLLFRGMHWHFKYIAKLLNKRDKLIFQSLKFETYEELDKFIMLHNNRRKVLPLFIVHNKDEFEPVSSHEMHVHPGCELVYVDVPKELPQSVKPKLEGVSST
ncbi:MAG: cation:proton antiporter [Microscillaceae bacterium]|nr:cation:proton antiporter [Microscillaceae bacterium]